MVSRMDAALEIFKELDPDSYEYLVLLDSKLYGWSILSSGREVYVRPLQPTTAEDAGNALRNIIKKINESRSQEEEVEANE